MNAIWLHAMGTSLFSIIVIHLVINEALQNHDVFDFRSSVVANTKLDAYGPGTQKPA